MTEPREDPWWSGTPKMMMSGWLSSAALMFRALVRERNRLLAGVHLGDEGLRALSDAATPGRWYVDGPEFGGMWVCVGHGDAQKSGAVHPSATDQPYAVLAGMGEADATLIVAAVNYVRAALAAQENPT